MERLQERLQLAHQALDTLNEVLQEEPASTVGIGGWPSSSALPPGGSGRKYGSRTVHIDYFLSHYLS